MTSGTLLGSFVDTKSLFMKITASIAGSLLIALLAQLKVYLPYSPVPVTGQTLGVVLAGALLGRKWGTSSVLLYLAQGFSGLPVFAGGVGVAVLLGPTAGYLLAFPIAAYFVGYLAEKGFDRTYLKSLIMFSLGLLPIFTLGSAWLAYLVGTQQAIATGVVPFLPGALAKTLFAATLLPSLRKFG